MSPWVTTVTNHVPMSDTTVTTHVPMRDTTVTTHVPLSPTRWQPPCAASAGTDWSTWPPPALWLPGPGSADIISFIHFHFRETDYKNSYDNCLYVGNTPPLPPPSTLPGRSYLTGGASSLQPLSRLASPTRYNRPAHPRLTPPAPPDQRWRSWATSSPTALQNCSHNSLQGDCNK